jgi:hypothetical protein
LLLLYLLLLLLLFLGLAFAAMDTPLPLPSKVRLLRPQVDGDCPRGASPPMGLGYFRGLNSRLVQTGIFYKSPGSLPPRPFPRMPASGGLAPCASCSWSSAPRAFYPVPSPPRLWKSNFCSRRASPTMGLTSIDHRRPFPLRAAQLWCFDLRAWPQWHCLRCIGHPWTSTI